MPDEPAVHLLLGQTLEKVGKLDEGSAELRQAQNLSLRKKDIAVAKQLTITGTQLLQVGRLPEAAAKLEESSRLDPEDAVTQYNYGIALMLENRLDEAIR
jgi:Flp pilus assembly protein TadD